MSSRICSFCGSVQNHTAPFCSQCGHPLGEIHEEPQWKGFLDKAHKAVEDLNPGRWMSQKKQEQDLYPVASESTETASFGEPLWSYRDLISSNIPFGEYLQVSNLQHGEAPGRIQMISANGAAQVRIQPEPGNVYVVANNPRRNSAPGIVALILAFFMPVIAFFLAILDIIVNRDCKHGCAVAALVISILMFFLSIIFIAGSGALGLLLGMLAFV